jgi:hypothetical protein
VSVEFRDDARLPQIPLSDAILQANPYVLIAKENIDGFCASFTGVLMEA